MRPFVHLPYSAVHVARFRTARLNIAMSVWMHLAAGPPPSNYSADH